MPVSARTLRAYELLAERERHRRELSLQPNTRYPSPENVFYSVANSLRHKEQNRYIDVLAYDRTSVKAAGRYLNANVVCAPGGHWWIAAQAPVPSTFGRYFHALYSGAASRHPLVEDRGSNTCGDPAVIIVQLTDYHERGRVKADRYIPEWIEGGTRERVYMSNDGKDIELELATESEERIEHLSATLTKASLYPMLRSGSEGVPGDQMKIRHYLFNAWPDHGVPTGQAVQKLKALVEHIGQERQRLGDCEVWVHCSAGVGRTGAFIALASLLLPPKNPPFPRSDSPLGPLPEVIRGDKVAEVVDQIREYRGMMVQTPEQMQLVYDLTS